MSGGPAPACAVWGIVNVTADSFSDGGAYLDPRAAIAQGRRLLAEGAAVIDVGGESSRPKGQTYGAGAQRVSPDEETRRVVPVVEALAAAGATVSIDTVKPEVAEAALRAGARVVNDVSGGQDRALFEVAAAHGADYVLMHTRGRGEVTPPNTRYASLLDEVLDELRAGVERALEAGLERERVWLDPGLGFAKTAAQSGALLACTAAFVDTGHKVIVGASRKSFIAELAAREPGRSGVPAAEAVAATGRAEAPPDRREGGSIAAAVIAAMAGAHAVRAHEVAATVQAVRLTGAVAGLARRGVR
ncbi:MAG: dihydropteroate synthase [Myxococcales bacterium]|nr:dihydropteroate synthase [Myxococcales bacterium]